MYIHFRLELYEDVYFLYKAPSCPDHLPSKNEKRCSASVWTRIKASQTILGGLDLHVPSHWTKESPDWNKACLMSTVSWFDEICSG